MTKNKPYLEVAERLKTLRGNIDVKEFAKELGIKIATYYRYERGETLISDAHLKVAEIIKKEKESKAISVADPEKDYDLQGGYKADPEKVLGVARGTPHWMAFDFLSKIYASKDQQLIEATFRNLKTFADLVERLTQRRPNDER